MMRYRFLKVHDGKVMSVNEAGNIGMTYYNGRDYGKAVRAYWSELGEGYVDIYTDTGKIVVVNKGGNLYRLI